MILALAIKKHARNIGLKPKLRHRLSLFREIRTPNSLDFREIFVKLAPVFLLFENSTIAGFNLHDLKVK